MCGIVGFYNSSRDPNTFPETIINMLSMISYRGPDQAGYFFDNNIGIGTVRLKVIDIQHGMQPMSDESSRFWISYNGEVYNYIELRDELKKSGIKFKTSSDTEVVVNAYKVWGKEAFKKLNGGFAFVIYDRVDKKIILVRDRFGERPLFYMCHGNEWIFGSEIKSFLAHGEVNIKFDPYKLQSLYAIWTPLPDDSVYEGIFQVPSGGYIEVDSNGNLKANHYYQLDFCEPQFKGSESEAIEKLRFELSNSVKLRLRSDVQVGTYLSGGIDSSIVTLLATKYSDNVIRTFSVGFERKEFDETSFQQEVSKHLGTNHEQVIISDQNILDNFDKALWHLEIPVFRTAFVPMYLLSKQVAHSGIKVVLTGEGSDEFFLGYDLYKETILRSSWNNTVNYEEKRNQLQKLYPYLTKIQENVSFLVPLYERFTKETIPGLFSHEMRFSNSSFNDRILNLPTDSLSFLKKYISLHEKEFFSLPIMKRAQWLECTTLLAGYLLSSQGDRMSYANSVESRLPFLDSNVIALSNSFSDSLKLTGDFNEKHILKLAFKDELPSSVVNRPKQPYLSPLPPPFLDKKNNIYFDLLNSKDLLEELEFINVDFVKSFIHKIYQTPYEKISHRENQAFLFLLSTLLLHERFTRRKYYFSDKKQLTDSLVCHIDGRAMESVC